MGPRCSARRPLALMETQVRPFAVPSPRSPVFGSDTRLPGTSLCQNLGENCCLPSRTRKDKPRPSSPRYTLSGDTSSLWPRPARMRCSPPPAARPCTRRHARLAHAQPPLWHEPRALRRRPVVLCHRHRRELAPGPGNTGVPGGGRGRRDRCALVLYPAGDGCGSAGVGQARAP